MNRASLCLALLAGMAVTAPAGTFVSFQEGDLRVGSDKLTVGTNGALVNAAYSMGATVIRSDIPSSPQDGNQLLVGNTALTTNRSLLSFDLSYVQSLVGTNVARVDSAALILTHDNAGAGAGSVHAVYLTSPFDEATATWNNPHGSGANAGGVIGATLRERSCIGTSASPARELWGSPAAAWADSGTGADLLVDAVRGALTNASRTLYLLVKRKSESASAYFSRYQHDGDADREFRPELIVGIDSLQGSETNCSALVAYGFNENSNSAPSLASVAMATVTDTNRIWTSNAAAGSGLGPFGYGGTTGNCHGYGTAAYVSAPSGFYARASVTSSSETGAVAAGDYVGFTLAPQPGFVLSLTGVSAWFKLQATNTLSASVAVRTSLDGFSNDVASLTVPGTGSGTVFTWLTNALGPVFANLVNPVEFRFYFYDQTDSTADLLRLDDVAFYGVATLPPAGMQIVTLTASDPIATESGGDNGAFTLRRYGDVSNALALSYTMSGTASNGLDYQFLEGAANFAPGVSNVTILLTPLDDSTPEWPETATLTLDCGSGYVIAGTNAATVTLFDDNDPPEFDVEATHRFALEGVADVSAVFTVIRPVGDTNTAVAVRFELSGTASNGVDYIASATNTLLFPSGSVQQDLTVTALKDDLPEGTETVVLQLLPGTGYTLGASNSATATIFDEQGTNITSLLLEAESFSERGGWVVDQQFVDSMGSPYLLAHGKGTPVPDATTAAHFSAPGVYRVWVRTKDWTAPLPHHPGAFQVVIDGQALAPVFGTVGQGWLWQDGGLVTVNGPSLEVRLHDLTGFDGRCDALFFTTAMDFVPTNSLPELTAWRRTELSLPLVPPSAGEFDLVVVGGGIAGSAASIAAARQGLQVALIHDRPFPGGNASRDVRVHTLGNPMDGIVTEINTPNYLIGSDEFIQSDERRMQVLLRETNIHLFTEWRAFAANTSGTHIVSVDAKHTRTGEERRFSAPLFIDSTGDGWVGYWAGALYRVGRETAAEFNESLAPTNVDAMVLGTTLSWNSRDTGRAVSFPAVPWATNVAKDYYQVRGDWYWEYGLTRDTVYDAEGVRDHLLQAIYGTWWNVKQRAGNENLDLGWVGYIGGKRESRRLVGDYVLTEADVRTHPAFADAVVNESREIDLHYPQKGFYDFLTYAQFTAISPYWIPFRCFYSTNIDNLMMAGRCLSATHVGLGSPRVMNTCGQMGVATGTAAALCKKYSVLPRAVAQQHAEELRSLIGLSGSSATPANTVAVVDNLDADHVTITGSWTSSFSVTGYYGADYLHDGNTNKGAKTVLFRPTVPLTGPYRVYLRWTAGTNRATNVPVDVYANDGRHTVSVDQSLDPAGWFLLGTFPFNLGTTGTVVVRTDGTAGYVIADAVALAADFEIAPGFSGVPWEDDDADGFCNYVEWTNGTDPFDPASYLSLHLAGQPGNWQLRFQAMPSRSYSVLYRDSLSGGNWLKLGDCDAGSLIFEAQITDILPPTNSARFYRLVSPKVP